MGRVGVVGAYWGVKGFIRCGFQFRFLFLLKEYVEDSKNKLSRIPQQVMTNFCTVITKGNNNETSINY